MQILAHRGLAGPDTPENTVEAVRAALEAGTDGVEVDVRLSADGVPLVCHDADLRRVAGHDCVIADTPWNVIRSIDLGGGHRVPSFAQVLAEAAGERVVAELKSGGRHRSADDIAARVTAEVRASGVDPCSLTFSSFDPRLVTAVRSRARDLPFRTAVVGSPITRPLALLHSALLRGFDQIHPHVLGCLTDRAIVDRAHSCGVEVFAWTVNAPRHLRALALRGVDGVITDVPRRARHSLFLVDADRPVA